MTAPYDKGMRILASTRADDVAWETAETQQGLLSYALVHDGLEEREADFRPADDRIGSARPVGRSACMTHTTRETIVITGASGRARSGRSAARARSAIGSRRPGTRVKWRGAKWRHKGS